MPREWGSNHPADVKRAEANRPRLGVVRDDYGKVITGGVAKADAQCAGQAEPPPQTTVGDVLNGRLRHLREEANRIAVLIMHTPPATLRLPADHVRKLANQL